MTCVVSLMMMGVVSLVLGVASLVRRGVVTQRRCVSSNSRKRRVAQIWGWVDGRGFNTSLLLSLQKYSDYNYFIKSTASM